MSTVLFVYELLCESSPKCLRGSVAAAVCNQNSRWTALRSTWTVLPTTSAQTWTVPSLPLVPLGRWPPGSVQNGRRPADRGNTRTRRCAVSVATALSVTISTPSPASLARRFSVGMLTREWLAESIYGSFISFPTVFDLLSRVHLGECFIGQGVDLQVKKQFSLLSSHYLSG